MERIEYPYLQDRDFLVKLDNQLSKKIHTKITLLQWDEKPIQEIQGYITGGSLTINGDSAIRRAGNLSVYLEDEKNAKITEVSNLYSINKKFYLEIGIENNTNQWLDYPILWFPQGVFVINGASASHSTSGTTLNLSFKDKMCLLSGDCGGTLSDTIEFHKYDTLDAEGEWITSYPTLYQIILECVNHLGKEDMSRIFIADVDTRIKKVMKWTGNIPVYITNPDDPQVPSEITTVDPGEDRREYTYGQDVGFIYTDFIWNDGELVSKPGDTIVSILDKIKNKLGNYEYFYDIWGNFHFQEKRNYLNISQATITETVGDEENIIIDFDNIKYNVMDLAKGKAEYDFSESPLIINYSNSPAYSRIKNDYVVWGQRTGVSGIKIPIRYHLAIDKKPNTGNQYDVVLIKDDNVIKAKKLIDFSTKTEFPNIGNSFYFYRDLSTNKVYIWDTTVEPNQYVQYSSLPFGYDELEYIESDGTIPISLGKIIGNEDCTLQILISPNNTGELMGIYADKEYSEFGGYVVAMDNLPNEFYPTYAALRRAFTTAPSGKYDNVTAINVIYPYYGTQYNITIDNNQNMFANIGEKSVEIKKNISSDNKYLIELNHINKKVQVKIDGEDYSSNFSDINMNLYDTILADWDFYLFQVNSGASTQTGAGGKLYKIIINGEEYIPCQKWIDEEEAKIGLYNINTDVFIPLDDIEKSDSEYKVFQRIVTTDWRTELYMQAIQNEPFGLKDHDYAAELEAEWPKIYDLVNQKIFDKYKERPEELDYWIDLIDMDTNIAKIGVPTIGRRSQAKQNDKVNCIFEPLIPDIVFIETGQPDTEQRRNECIDRGQKWAQVEPSIFEHFAQGGSLNSAYYEVQDMLYQGSSYNEAISLSTIPVYYLEPNTIINVFDKDSDIHGDYLIKSISIPLGVSGTSNISAQRALNKF